MDTRTTGPRRGRLVAVAALGKAPARLAVPVMVVLPRLLGTMSGRPSPWPMIFASLPAGEVWFVVLGIGRSAFFVARIVNFLRIDGLLPRREPGGAGRLTLWRMPVDQRASALVPSFPRAPHRYARRDASRWRVVRPRTLPRYRKPTVPTRDETRSPALFPPRPVAESPVPATAH